MVCGYAPKINYVGSNSVFNFSFNSSPFPFYPLFIYNKPFKFVIDNRNRSAKNIKQL